MDQEFLDALNKISYTFKQQNKKLKLIILLDKAKKAYDEYDFDSCTKDCKKLLKEFPTNNVALRGLGCVEQSKGHYKKALKYYFQALETSDTKEIEYTLIADLYYLMNDLDNALKYFNLAIDVNNYYELALEGRADVMLIQHVQILDLQDNLIKQKIF